MPKDGKDKSKDKSTTSKPTASQGDGDSDIEEEQIKVYKIAACFVLQVQFCTPEAAFLTFLYNTSGIKVLHHFISHYLL